MSPFLQRAAKLLVETPMGPRRIAGRVRGGTLERAVGDRVVLVTGASSGIGAATARRTAAAGATVVLTARDPDALGEVRDAILADGGRAHVAPADLSDLDDVERVAAEVLDRHGRVDVLVNNAGRSIHRPVLESLERMHDYQRTMQLNYFGAVRLTLALLPGMVERGSGRIVNVSTWGTQTTAPGMGAYVASKAALDAFSRSIAADLERTGVRVSTVHMPLVRTPMVVPNRLYDNIPTLSSDDAAGLICQAIITGSTRVSTRIGNISAIADAFSTWPIEQTNRVVGRLQATPSARRRRSR